MGVSNTVGDFKRKPEHEQRTQQSLRMLRMIKIHQLTEHGTKHSGDDVRRIADELGVTERTVYRHLKTLRMIYDEVGRSFD